MNALLHMERLHKRYGHHEALAEVTLTVPQGRVVALVGPNGAGKSTLLNLAVGTIQPTSGTIEVLGARPAANAAQLARVGFVAQDTPVYAQLTVDEHLRLGARLNPGWDDRLARQRIAQVGLSLAQKAGRLSGGQRAQLALTLVAAKRPQLMIFDEPVASLDPLARRAFLQSLMEFVAELEVSVVLSSHIIGDLERVCDHLILLAAAHVQLAGPVEELLAEHYRLVGARGALETLPAGIEAVHAEHTARQSTLIVRDRTGTLPQLLPDAERLDLEDLVLAYLTRAANVTVGAVGRIEQPVEAQR